MHYASRAKIMISHNNTNICMQCYNHELIDVFQVVFVDSKYIVHAMSRLEKRRLMYGDSIMREGRISCFSNSPWLIFNFQNETR